jgi:hypothetical protein
LNWIFLLERFDKKEIESYNRKLKKYAINTTELIFLQDCIDRFLSLKGDILNELKGSQKMDDRDVKIAQLENEITANRFDGVSIYNESNILFPTIEKFSIANHNFLLPKDSVFKETVVVILSKKPFETQDKKKFEDWLKATLKCSSI